MVRIANPWSSVVRLVPALGVAGAVAANDTEPAQQSTTPAPRTDEPVELTGTLEMADRSAANLTTAADASCSRKGTGRRQRTRQRSLQD